MLTFRIIEALGHLARSARTRWELIRPVSVATVASRTGTPRKAPSNTKLLSLWSLASAFQKLPQLPRCNIGPVTGAKRSGEELAL